LFKLKGAAGFTPLMSVLRDVAAGGRDGLTNRQRDALEAVSRVFRLT
jgi:hypothetical protein